MHPTQPDREPDQTYYFVTAQLRGGQTMQLPCTSTEDIDDLMEEIFEELQKPRDKRKAMMRKGTSLTPEGVDSKLHTIVDMADVSGAQAVIMNRWTMTAEDLAKDE